MADKEIKKAYIEDIKGVYKLLSIESKEYFKGDYKSLKSCNLNELGLILECMSHRLHLEEEA